MPSDLAQSLPYPEAEIITMKQFASRMGISRSTAYSWLASGRLAAGRHVIRLGRVIRVLWRQELLNDLLSQSAVEQTGEVRPRLQRHGKGGRNRVAIAPDLLENL